MCKVFCRSIGFRRLLHSKNSNRNASRSAQENRGAPGCRVSISFTVLYNRWTLACAKPMNGNLATDRQLGLSPIHRRVADGRIPAVHGILWPAVNTFTGNAVCMTTNKKRSGDLFEALRCARSLRSSDCLHHRTEDFCSVFAAQPGVRCAVRVRH